MEGICCGAGCVSHGRLVTRTVVTILRLQLVILRIHHWGLVVYWRTTKTRLSHRGTIPTHRSTHLTTHWSAHRGTIAARCAHGATHHALLSILVVLVYLRIERLPLCWSVFGAEIVSRLFLVRKERRPVVRVRDVKLAFSRSWFYLFKRVHLVLRLWSWCGTVIWLLFWLVVSFVVHCETFSKPHQFHRANPRTRKTNQSFRCYESDGIHVERLRLGCQGTSTKEKMAIGNRSENHNSRTL